MAEEIHQLASPETPSTKIRTEEILGSDTHRNILQLALEASETRYPDGSFAQGGSATAVPLDRWDGDQTGNLQHGIFVRFGGFVKEWKLFDRILFGISKEEAQSMDPQQRCLLQDAASVVHGIHMDKNSAVFLGIGRLEESKSRFEITQQAILQGKGTLSTARASSAAAGRISFAFDMRGPCVAIDTACSSTLVSLKLLQDHFRGSILEDALLCGANLPMSQSTSLMFAASGMLSVDGRCKALDSSADGYGRSEALSVVRISARKTKADSQLRNAPLGYVLSSAINQDGRSSSLTAPRGPSQEALVRSALHQVPISASEINAMGLHGTGTPLGDPIEISALSRTLDWSSVKSSISLLASKTCFGHSETVSGLLGLMHLSESLQNHCLPPFQYLTKINQLLVPFFPPTGNTALARQQGGMAMPDQERGRTIGTVSAFAFQGTNAFISIGHDISTINERRKQMNFKMEEFLLLPEIHATFGHCVFDEQVRKVEIDLAPRTSDLLDHCVNGMPVLSAATSIQLFLEFSTSFWRSVKSPTGAENAVFLAPVMLGQVNGKIACELQENRVSLVQHTSVRQRSLTTCTLRRVVSRR